MADLVKVGPGRQLRIDRVQGLGIIDQVTEAIIRDPQVQEATIVPHQE